MNGGDGGHDSATTGDGSQVTGSWTMVSAGTTLDIRTVWAAAPNDAYAIAPRTLLHYDGTSWSPMGGMPGMYTYSLSSAGGTGSMNVWLLGITIPANGSGDMGMLVFQSNSSGMFMDMMPTLPASLGSMHFASATNAWAVGSMGVAAHYDGTTWTSANTGIDPAQNLTGVFTIGPSDAIAVGENIWRWNGTSWTMQPTVRTDQDHSWTAVWGFSASDIWVVGQLAYVQHWDGTQWSDVDPGATFQGDFYGAWGAAPNDLWVVGASGSIAHWNGVQFSPVMSPTTRDLHGISGTSATDVWAVGDHGTAIHYHM
jgi:hypothetical protein